MVTARFWVLVEARRGSTWDATTAAYKVNEVKAKMLYQQKPTASADQEAIEVEIAFPDGYFDSNSPKVHITVPPPAPAQAPQTTTVAQVKPKAPSAAAAIIHGN